MIILNVFFEVKAEERERFLKLLTMMVKESNKEQDCTLYQLAEDVLQPNTFTLIEHWNSEEALKLHQETHHWNQFIHAIEAHLAQPLKVEQYTI